MGSSDGRQGAASPQASATSSPLTAEDAERFASVLKPMWELDSAPQAAAPVAIASPASAVSAVAAPTLSVKTRQMHGTAVNGTRPYPAIIAPAPSRDSSHEFDDLAQLPRGPSASPEAMSAAPVTEPSPPEPPNAFAVEAHLPPRRQQISEPRASVEVEAPPQTVPTPSLRAASSSGSFSADAAVAHASFGPTAEQLRARAARVQPTLVLNKDDIAGFPSGRSRAPLFVGLGAIVLVAAGTGAFLMNGARAASAPLAASATSAAAPASSPGSMSAMSGSGAAAMPIPAPAPLDTPEPAAVDTAESAQVAAAPVTPAAAAAAPAPAPSPTPAPVRPAAAGMTGTAQSANNGSSGNKWAPGKAASKPVPGHKAPSAIVRSSPF